VFYLKPGDKLDLDIDALWGSYKVNTGSEENKSIQKWQELIRPITAFGYQTNLIHSDTTPINNYVETYKAWYRLLKSSGTILILPAQNSIRFSV
jgi:hypothetical protein